MHWHFYYECIRKIYNSIPTVHSEPLLKIACFRLVDSGSFGTRAQCIFWLFLSGCFFPPNDRAQNHAQENPLLVLFLLAEKCLWTLIPSSSARNSDVYLYITISI
jgi:hypothetical protein